MVNKLKIMDKCLLTGLIFWFLLSPVSLFALGTEADPGSPLAQGLKMELQGGDESSQECRITMDSLRGAVLMGTAQNNPGGYLVTLEKLGWFNNWAEGWTEAEFPLEGEIQVVKNTEGSWSLRVSRAPVIDPPSSARLRHFGTYYTGDQALSLLTRRWDRIQAAVEVLKGKFPGEYWDYLGPEFRWDRFSWVPNFQEGVRGFLFPEYYGWKDSPVPPGPTRYAESLNWNLEYTRNNFPEILGEVRNSGTLFRDWEESSGLWRLSYLWKELWEQKIPAQVLHLQRR